ncbi:uncharacterized protein LOC122649804 [Telopea speciosissima]|uniref:uncharacterized protein LOC122649804 n=1 Tax=Telopea speciosissima TaxID=54955 RepID=UPI001CC76B2A|nr:uncharacterized protein LOC122649804 [Telopea speciosissima]
MRPLSSLGIGLSLVFGFLLLALVAELYYLLWWKKRFTNREIDDDYSSPGRELFYPFCWKKPPLLSSTALSPQELCTSVRITGAHGHETENQLNLCSGSNRDFLLKPFEEDDDMDLELMMLHNLAGPPRFLFTIKEETKEDLESEDGKSRGDRSRKGSRSRSLSEILTVETPFLTPLSSPQFFTPPLTPVDSHSQHGFNPFYESSTGAELNRIRSSPPPKFGFLKNAEEKLYRRKLIEEAQKKIHKNGGFVQDGLANAPPASSVVTNEEDGSFITIIVGKNKEREFHHHHQLAHHHSSASQVLPLDSSPSTIQPVYRKPVLHSSPMLR